MERVRIQDIMKRLIVTNIMETLNDWTLAFNNKQSNTAAHVDFSKAFDTIRHSKLANNKPRAYGVSGNVM